MVWECNQKSRQIVTVKTGISKCNIVHALTLLLLAVHLSDPFLPSKKELAGELINKCISSKRERKALSLRIRLEAPDRSPASSSDPIPSIHPASD